MKQQSASSSLATSGMPVSVVEAPPSLHEVKTKYRVAARVAEGGGLLETIYGPAIFFQINWAILTFDIDKEERSLIHLIPGEDHDEKYREMGLNPDNPHQMYVLGFGISSKENPAAAAVHRKALQECWLAFGSRRQSELQSII